MSADHSAEPLAAIRRLTVGDADAYRTIRLEGLARHPEAFGAPLAVEAAAPLEFFTGRLRDSAVFGGFDGAAIVGVAGYYRETTETVRHKGVLFGMYVRDGARRRGLAKRLVTAVLEDARGELEWLRLNVGALNTAALRLYEECGFERYGVEPFAIKVGDRYYDEALMQVRLAD